MAATLPYDFTLDERIPTPSSFVFVSVLMETTEFYETGQATFDPSECQVTAM